MKANLLGASALLLASFTLGACAEQRMIPAPNTAPAPAPRPAYRPAPRPAYQPAPPPATAWADLPATPGDWRWSQEGGQSVARFAGGRLTLRCDVATRSVRIERSEPGAVPSGPATLTLRTQTQSRALSAVPQAGALAVSLGARDPLLDAMAFSRGRFAVEGGGMPALRVPSWAEVSRVIEDCR
jgi:hypothetical protein